MDGGSFQNGVEWKEMPDGSLKITCSKCFEEYFVKPNVGPWGMFHENSSLIKDNLCIKCYKSSKQQERKEVRDEMQDRIVRGQAKNLATMSMAEDFDFGSKEYWEEWDKRVGLFVDKIIEKQS